MCVRCGLAVKGTLDTGLCTDSVFFPFQKKPFPMSPLYVFYLRQFESESREMPDEFWLPVDCMCNQEKGVGMYVCSDW